MIRRLSELADLVGGSVIGDSTIEIKGFSTIKDAEEGDITFIAHSKYLPDLERTKASAVIIGEDIADSRLKTQDSRLNLLKVNNPYLAFIQILELYTKKPYQPTGISKKATVGKDCHIGKDVSIYPYVVLEDGVKIGNRVTLFPGVYVGKDSEIGEESLIYPNVTIREGVKIGERVIIHSGTVIGSDGFGFVEKGGTHHKIPQIGGVVIEDDVEIGANCTIDRATLGNTIIKKGTKVDNLVQIAHNVTIGEDSLIVAQVGIAGSVEIGNRVTLAGQVGIGDHIKIGNNVKVGGKSGVIQDVGPDQVVSGMPAIAHKDWLKAQAIFARLPELKKKVMELEERIKNLEGGRDGDQ